MVRWALCCLILLSPGCERGPSDTIVFALSSAPSVLDPRLAGDAVSERVNALIYEPLARLDPDGSPRPAMADWEMLSPTHFRVRLRAGRRPFPDGRLPDASDVVATYETLLRDGFGSPHAGALGHVDEVMPMNDHLLDFRLSRPDPRFASRLTIGIVPAERSGDDRLVHRPYGSGNFEFLAWDDTGALLLRRRRDGQRIAFVEVPDPTMRALKLERAEAHIAQNDLPAEIIGYLDSAPDIRIRENTGTSFAYIGFNLADPLLADIRIRRAIAHAVDRQAIIRHLFADRATAAESVIRPTHWAGVGDLAPYRYDPPAARALMAEAGFGPANPLRLSYKTSTDPFRLRIAHVLQHQLAAVDIELDISSYDWGTFFGDIKAGRFQIYSLAWVGVNTPDILRYAFHSDSRPPAGANRGGYSSPEVDRLIDDGDRRTLADARDRYVQAQRLIHRDLVYVPLWYESNVAALRNVEDYRPGFDGNYLALDRVRPIDGR